MSEKELALSNADSENYWKEAQAGHLVLRKCIACGHVHFPPRFQCPKCWSDQLEWQQSSGMARVHSYTIVHRAPSPEHASRVPYVVAILDLDEGPRMVTNIIGDGAASVKIGDRVEVVFEQRDGVALPQFKRTA